MKPCKWCGCGTRAACTCGEHCFAHSTEEEIAHLDEVLGRATSRNKVRLTDNEVAALQHALPLAWPILETHADEAAEDGDYKYADGMRKLAKTCRELYGRIEP
jgi:hypothetical protein